MFTLPAGMWSCGNVGGHWVCGTAGSVLFLKEGFKTLQNASHLTSKDGLRMRFHS